MGSYIKIDRKILEWEWYRNEHTKNVFLHCLLKANWKDGRFEGKIIPRGSFLTSVKNLSKELDLTEDEVRTALSHLVKTGELTKQTTNKYTVITVSNYTLYQNVPEQIPDKSQTDTGQIPDRYQTDTRQSPNKSQTIPKLFPTIEEYKEKKEGKKERREEVVTARAEKVSRSEVQSVLAAWNALQTYGIKPVSGMKNSTERYRHLTARIAEYGAEDILAAVDRIKQSDFLRGKNRKGWMITFDWFIRPNNFPKVLEGNYDNKSGDDGNGQTGRNDAENVRDPYAAEFEKLLGE